MRKALIASLAVAAALIVAAAATAAHRADDPGAPAAIPGCAKASLDLLEPGTLTIGADNPAFPPWFGGAEKKPWKVSDPYSGKGYESAVAYAVAKQLGFSKAQVSGRYAVQQLLPAGQEAVRLLHHAGLVQPAARQGGRLLEGLLLREPVRRRPQGHADRVACTRSRAEEVQARSPGRDDELQLHRQPDQADSQPPRSTTRTTRPRR